MFQIFFFLLWLLGGFWPLKIETRPWHSSVAFLCYSRFCQKEARYEVKQSGCGLTMLLGNFLGQPMLYLISHTWEVQIWVQKIKPQLALSTSGKETETKVWVESTRAVGMSGRTSSPTPGPSRTYLMVWSQILTVQSELQEMKTFKWKGFQLIESTAMWWASNTSRNWLEYVFEHCNGKNYLVNRSRPPEA